MHSRLLSVLMGVALFGTKPQEPRTYRIAAGSRFEVTTAKAGLLSFAGHAHVIRARAVEGKIVYGPETLAQSRVEITVSTESLEVLTPPDTEEIRKVTAAMRRDVLAVERYRTITFVSRRIAATDSGVRIVGALTMVGKTVDVPVDVRLQVRQDTMRARARFAVLQTAFGIKPYRGGPGGTVRVADRITFDIAVVAVRE